MSELATYTGGCHCGNVRYEAKADLSSVMACNCSICGRKGALMSFVSGDAFKLLTGEGKTTDYQFNKKHIHHLFCSTCGIHSYASGKGKDGVEMYMLNVRCLDNVDVEAIPVKHHDGKHS